MSSSRIVPLVTGEIYHVYNRGIDKRATFLNDSYYQRAYQTIKYYQYSTPPMRLSYFLRQPRSVKENIDFSEWGDKLIQIMAYCFMPNHFHLLIRQEVDGGISKFIGNFVNSYTRYFNTRNKRVGGLFLENFKNVLVDNEEYLLHLSRYIHLNPYSSGVVKDYSSLLNYDWSSIKDYIGGSEDVISNKDMIMNYFSTKEKYKDFVLDRADYQKQLKQIEHLMIED